MKQSTAAARQCPVAPAAHTSVQARALHRACLIVGGIGPLSQCMEVPQSALDAWLRGEGEPPEAVFHQAVEIILLHAAGGGAAN